MPPSTTIHLHLPAIPHTITHSRFSHCAFTGKVLRFAPMMRSRGFEVYHYGVAGSDSGATREIELLSEEEWSALRLRSWLQLHPGASEADARASLDAAFSFVGDLANLGTPLYAEFNRRLACALKLHYRSPGTDIVCLPLGRAHEAALAGANYTAVETGIGYPDSFLDYRVFESYAWLHHKLGELKRSNQNYWFVAPNYYDSEEWPFSHGAPPDTPRVGFFGRLQLNKGLAVFAEIARRFPDVEFVLCGQGDPRDVSIEWPDNVVYTPPLEGAERAEYLGGLTVLVAPSNFVEPFCGVTVEAQLCGTPVLAPESGAPTETVKHGVTGLLCHTLADYCHGVEMALRGEFDREHVRRRALRRYDMFAVAHRYEYIFRTILDVHNGRNGWYAPDSYVAATYAVSNPQQNEIQTENLSEFANSLET